MKAWFSRRSVRWMVLLFLPLSLPVMAQQPVAPPEATAAPAFSPDPHISLNVVVSDRSDKPVAGLQQQDFTVLDNKLPQKLVSFRAVEKSTAEAPTEVILLIDAVNARFTTVSYERNEIAKFLGQNSGKLAQPVSIIFFTDQNTRVQTAPTRDGKALLASFDQNVTGLRTITRSEGFYGAVDRLQLSLRTIGTLTEYEARKPGRKVVIWISPGWPILSGPRIELTNREERQIFNSVVGLSTALRQARITLYSIDPLGTTDAGGLRTIYYEEFLKGVPSPNKVQAGNLALQVLAVQSGGLALHSSNDITGSITRCSQDADIYYELSIDPAKAEHPDEYHGLEVKIDKPGLVVRTRTGYYAQP